MKTKKFRWIAPVCLMIYLIVGVPGSLATAAAPLNPSVPNPAPAPSPVVDSATLSLGSVVKVREIPHWKDAIDSALKDLPTVLLHYTPVLRNGARLINKTVAVQDGFPNLNVGIEMYFHSAVMRGIVRQSPMLCGSDDSSKGFRIDMDVTKSDSLISDNISTAFMEICGVESPSGSITFTANTFIRKGPGYQDASPITKTVLGVVGDQLEPLLVALLDVATINSSK